MEQEHIDGLRKLCEANEPGRCVSMGILRQLIELIDEQHQRITARQGDIDSLQEEVAWKEGQQKPPEAVALQARIDELVEQLEAGRKKARELQEQIHVMNRNRHAEARRLIEEALDAL